MEQFDYKDNTYYFVNGKFTDEHFITLNVSDTNEVAEYYCSHINYENYDRHQLYDLINQVKSSGAYFLAIKIIKYGLDKFCNNDNFLMQVLPIYSSALRLLYKPREAIAVFGKYESNIYALSMAFLTSIASAYCDIKDYDNALKCANRAYAMQGGSVGERTELTLVFARIKKEREEN